MSFEPLSFLLERKEGKKGRTEGREKREMKWKRQKAREE